MSAAATQAAPPSGATLDPMSLPSSANRQYQPSQQQQSPSRDAYYASPNSRASPSSTSPRPASGRSSHAAATGSRYEPRPREPQAPRASSPAESNSTTPRQQPVSSMHDASAVPPSTSAPSPVAIRTRPTNAQQQQHAGPPIPPPPRTSSHQPNHYAGTSSSGGPQQPMGSPADARSTGAHRPSSSRSARGPDARERGTRESAPPEPPERPHDSAAAAAAAARSRRQGRPSPREDQVEAATNARSPRVPSNAVHLQSDDRISPSNAAIEASAPSDGVKVISRVVIDDPAVDYDRARARLAEAQPSNAAGVTPVTGLGLVGSEGVDDGGRGGSRGRQDYSSGHSGRKETRFGDYILGRTLGEGEFGKVKMGWKQEGGVQVAIKLIRRESLGTNPSRLPKINREITILRELSHPNIVRLHEMVETDRYIGIILEYASGGELFDYILNHRYLKDPAARRLFAQLVSGVGYLHKKGIVHRDLKLENLLLDRNKNIIITDFGFANTFDPTDELGDEIEFHLTDKEFVKRMDLARVRDNGFRRGDLMQTSCGSPCYAAPELVVTDSLYTGRKVDVWSCGVILYAMLAGYLPFDDDPANPEGDNINLLYKYIVTTPLTFPEYVTPHARDLLRRILVANPRKRADLFEVARHSWLSEYAHVVSFITSSTTRTEEIANTTVTADHHQETPLLARSASVREPVKSHQPHLAVAGGLSLKHAQVDHDTQASPGRARDTKRRTVQLEYVPPTSQTARGSVEGAIELAPPATTAYRTSPPTDRVRHHDDAPIDVSGAAAASPVVTVATRSKASGAQPTSGTYHTSPGRTRAQQVSSTSGTAMAPPARPARDPPRSASDSTAGLGAGTYIARPNTGGSITSTGSRSGSTRLPSRGSYSRPGQPSAPAVATTNAQGRLAQPSNGKPYVISNPIPRSDDPTEPYVDDQDTGGRPTPPESAGGQPTTRTHKRSNTVSGIGEKIFGRSGSLFGGRSQAQGGPAQSGRRSSKAYPPTSMQTSMKTGTPRQSVDSRRSASFGFGRTDSAGQEKPKRFSFLPASFSFKNIGGGGSGANAANRDVAPPRTSHSMTEPGGFGAGPTRRAKPTRPGMAFGRGASQSTDEGLTGYGIGDEPPQFEAAPRTRQQGFVSSANTARPYLDRNPAAANHARAGRESGGMQGPGESASTVGSEPSHRGGAPPPSAYPPNYDDHEGEVHGTGSAWRPDPASGGGGGGSGMHKPARRNFTDAYESGPDRRYPRGGHGGGSNSAARRVMEFFRLRGKARTWDDR